MPTPSERSSVPLDRSQAAILRAAAEVLVAAPQSTLAEVATALGMGRTSLHRMFPTRKELLTAIAHTALTEIAAIYKTAGIGVAVAPELGLESALRKLVTGLIPLGSSLMFLVRAPELADDENLARAVAELDRPLIAAIRQAQLEGELADGVPPWWAVETLFAVIYTAWEHISQGRLARLDAPELVLSTWLTGVGANPTRPRPKQPQAEGSAPPPPGTIG